VFTLYIGIPSQVSATSKQRTEASRRIISLTRIITRYTSYKNTQY